MTTVEMDAILRNIAQMSNIIYAKEPHWNQKAMTLGAPAAARDITKFLKRFAKEVPPVYVQFLKLFEGCSGFWPGYQFLNSKDDFSKTTLSTGKYTVFAANAKNERLLFNTRKKSSARDFEVIHCTAEGMIEDRYPDFAAFLGTTAYFLQSRILDKGYSAALQRQVKKKVPK